VPVVRSIWIVFDCLLVRDGEPSLNFAGRECRTRQVLTRGIEFHFEGRAGEIKGPDQQAVLDRLLALGGIVVPDGQPVEFELDDDPNDDPPNDNNK
jgi:hypothetical protein